MGPHFAAQQQSDGSSARVFIFAINLSPCFVKIVQFSYASALRSACSSEEPFCVALLQSYAFILDMLSTRFGPKAVILAAFFYEKIFAYNLLILSASKCINISVGINGSKGQGECHEF
jgi:hypothetical protein